MMDSVVTVITLPMNVEEKNALSKSSLRTYQPQANYRLLPSSSSSSISGDPTNSTGKNVLYGGVERAAHVLAHTLRYSSAAGKQRILESERDPRRQKLPGSEPVMAIDFWAKIVANELRTLAEAQRLSPTSKSTLFNVGAGKRWVREAIRVASLDALEVVKGPHTFCTNS
ncbi:hypothetical protein R1sor_023409 [Riccia sorocarpa]|uniref:Uncharacterized protein n=1 Tax=Riccia sorocarpa TaxID=122646 RepID=A0ABD3GNC5_9MARC